MTKRKRANPVFAYVHVDSLGSMRRRQSDGMPFIYPTKEVADAAKPHEDGEIAYLSAYVRISEPRTS